MTTLEGRSAAVTRPDFDPFSPAFLADPYPFFAEYRQQTPVFYGPTVDYWVHTSVRRIVNLAFTPRVASCSRPTSDAPRARA
jgi:hypothetical protein